MSGVDGTDGNVPVASATAGGPSERRRQQRELELAVGTASQLPQRDPGPLRFPPFRTLLRP